MKNIQIIMFLIITTKVLRSLPHLSPPRATAVCGALLAKLHLLARGDKVDTRFWLALSHYIKAQECPVLEPAVRDLLSLSKKVTVGCEHLLKTGSEY